VVRDEPNDRERSADEEYDDRDQEDHVKGQVAGGQRRHSTATNL